MPERESVGARPSPPVKPPGWFDRLLEHVPVHLAATQTGRRAALVVGGNVTNKALVFLIQMVLIRTMAKAEFALFSVVVMTLEVVTELADLGLNVNLVRNYSRYAERDRNRALSVVWLILRVKVLWVFFLTIVFYLLAPHFALLLHKPEMSDFLRLAAIGLAAPVMIYFALSHLQAVQWFGRYILINIFERAGLLVLISILALTGSLWLFSAVTVWIFFPYVAAILALALTPRDYDRIKRIEPGVGSEVFHFGKWALLSNLLTLIMLRLDVFMLTALSTEEQVADFVVAVRLAALAQVASAGLSTALLPRVGRFVSVGECRAYMRNVWKLAPVLALGAALVCLVARPVMTIPFGAKVSTAVPLFRLVLAGEVMWLFLVPPALLLYRFNRVDLICLTNALMLIVSAIANGVLIPRLGGTGAAVAYVLARGVAMVSVLITASYCLRRGSGLDKLAQKN